MTRGREKEGGDRESIKGRQFEVGYNVAVSEWQGDAEGSEKTRVFVEEGITTKGNVKGSEEIQDLFDNYITSIGLPFEISFLFFSSLLISSI